VEIIFSRLKIGGNSMNSLFSEDVLVPIALFAMVVLLVWFGHKIKRTRIQEGAELRKRLLDKFSSGNELAEFLATPQGQSFLKDAEANGLLRTPKGRIVTLVAAGVVLVMLGGAFYGLMSQQRSYIYPGTILSALGIGILVAAAISHHLYKKWNMLK
jgi:hypothetical protein